MEDILRFAGSYWWLIFFLGPATAGAFRAVTTWQQKRSKLRHRQKLELIEAKTRAREAELSARSKAERMRTPGNDDIETADARGRQERLQRLLTTHDEVSRRWLDYELDVAKLIAFPTMSDGRQPLTAAFLRAKKAADGLRPASAETRIDAATLAEYRDAVHDFEVAFDVAEQDARRVRDTGFTEPERKRLDRAQQLLKTAVDQSATAAERRIAYQRVRDELDGLIALSDDAIEVLEHRVAPQLDGPAAE